ncbi:MAG: 4-alpha-glucanotransferase, partial [Bacillota bacterium]|nr:4-alpha-glucanotransferase [Bacillota bacterium]
MRSAGILMPITSLPSPYGIGTIGKTAYRFADFLKASGQKYWQILPVGPTSFGDSPYQSFSTYAGNPYFIDLDFLCDEGLLFRIEIKDLDWGDNPEEVDYEKIFNNRFNVLHIAYERFKEKDQKPFENFIKENDSWLPDYSLYMSVKKHFGMRSWSDWNDSAIRLRKPEGIKKYREMLKDEIHFWEFVQFLFFTQWENFRSYVNSLGILIIGDMPIYVAMDSVDTWANPEVFWLDKDRKPVRVAGCPPDYFAVKGQLWGNPLYDWKYLKSTNYEWWFKRIKAADKLFDITRIDHFRAFDSYYAIPYPAEDAVIGDWLEGPGIKFFELMKKKLGDIPIIAEDLGLLTPGVIKLLKDSGYPGMKILEFAFGGGSDNSHLPYNYNNNSIVYSGTHDNETIMGWFETARPKAVEHAVKYCHLTKDEGYNWGIIRTAYESVCDYAIIQMQDILALDNSARFNTPSTLGGNWVWRMCENALTKELSNKLKDLAKTYGRLEENKKMAKNDLMENLVQTAKNAFCKELEELSPAELHLVLGKAIMGEIADRWEQS